MTESIADRAIRTLTKHWPASIEDVSCIVRDVAQMTELETYVTISDALLKAGEPAAAALMLRLLVQRRAEFEEKIKSMRASLG